MQIKTILLFAVAIFIAVSANESNKNNDANELKREWWHNGLFYQIYPRSFKDSGGDGIGDIKGIIEKLDYLKELNVDGIILGPIYKSPMVDFGYDVEEHNDVDPSYGKTSDMLELFEEAKKRKIKIIMDFVPNHTSDQCEWFKKSVQSEEHYKDYYIWHNGKVGEFTDEGLPKPPNNWNSQFYGSAWTWNEDRKQYYYHQFAKEQPDLDFRNQAVVEHVNNLLGFWLKLGASGLRIGAVNHLFEEKEFADDYVILKGQSTDPLSYDHSSNFQTKDLPENFQMLYKWRETVDALGRKYNNQSFVLFSEAYIGKDKKNIYKEYKKYYGSKTKKGAHIPFNFVFIDSITRESSVNDIKAAIDDTINNLPKNIQANWVTGNHDQSRLASRYGTEWSNGILTLAMTLPGVAVTYYGDEIGMLDFNKMTYKDTVDPKGKAFPETDARWRKSSRDPQRTPMQWNSKDFAGFSTQSETWLPINPDYIFENVEDMESDSKSTLKFYKQLSELRKHDTFVSGSFESKVMSEHVLAYVRALDKQDTFVVLINFGRREESIDLNAFNMTFNDDVEIVACGANTCCENGAKASSKNVHLGKYGSIILKSVTKTPSSATAIGASTIGLLLAILIAQFII